MSIINQYFNERIDPFTLEKHPKQVKVGDTQPVSGDYVVYPAITAPTTANEFGRIEIELPEIPFMEDIENYPFNLYKNSEDLTNKLTRINTSPSDVTNSYMLAKSDSNRRHCVWLSNDLAGATIIFNYYGLGTVINASNMQDLRVTSLKGNLTGNVTGNVTGNATKIDGVYKHVIHTQLLTWGVRSTPPSIRFSEFANTNKRRLYSDILGFQVNHDSNYLEYVTGETRNSTNNQFAFDGEATHGMDHPFFFLCVYYYEAGYDPLG